MKRLISFIGLCFGSVAILLYSQAQNTGTQREGQSETSFILDDESVVAKEIFGADLSKSLYTIVLDTFEQAGLWSVEMPSEQGFALRRSILGAPLPLSKAGAQEVQGPSQERIPPRIQKDDGTYETQYFVPYQDEHKNVLGVKVFFHNRGYHRFSMKPYTPIYVEGEVKSFELWVAGRRRKHSLSVIVEDVRGVEHKLVFGQLNFFGWKKVAVQVPDSVIQFDHKFSSKRGLRFKGLLVECSPLEAQGHYYMYLDNLTAEVSRFWEEYKDQKDPMDVW